MLLGGAQHHARGALLATASENKNVRVHWYFIQSGSQEIIQGKKTCQQLQNDDTRGRPRNRTCPELSGYCNYEILQTTNTILIRITILYDHVTEY